ncbi:MAG: hypothetical protein KIT27_05585 [Legionellales bacterium]|nr:hypothetical protein [Legionellales bacterium]
MSNDTVTKPRQARIFSSKITELEQQIQQTRARYEKILQKRKLEIGDIAIQAGLGDFNSTALLAEFQLITKKLNHDQFNKRTTTHTQEDNSHEKATLPTERKAT